jgi:dihydroneopterin aldolase/2-amino-4-hydroxy-6-hydroxymethyldihydropteridine diphosphokinase
VVRDRIDISGLRAVAIVGALPHEREIPQPLQIDLSLEVDLRDAGASDELGDTVHYGDVADRVVAIVVESKDVLLERLVARIAELVLGFDRVEAVEVVLTKLRPPLAVDAVSTSVRIRRSRNDVEISPLAASHAFIALGSNLGDRRGFLRAGVRSLGPLIASSQVYETDPIGGPDEQGPYLNMVVQIETRLDPFALLRRCQRIEAESMRQRVVRWGPRTLDVDLVLYDEVVIQSPDLVLPHPRFAERRFVLAPLSEIAPDRCPDGWDERLAPAGVHPRGPLDLS